jgi:hypothetical protein
MNIIWHTGLTMMVVPHMNDEAALADILTTLMLKVTGKKRARYWLEIREQAARHFQS